MIMKYLLFFCLWLTLLYPGSAVAVEHFAFRTLKTKISKLLDTAVDVVVSDKDIDLHAAYDSRKDLPDGSGFIVDENGYIFTNCHVIDSAEKIDIVLRDGGKYTAKVVGKDQRSDIALLKIDVDVKLPVVEFPDLNHKIEVLDPIIVIGNPCGFGKTVTCGAISCERRDLSPQMAELGKGGDLVSYVQIDASVNYGNSGGPVFNQDGKMIGMVTVFIPDSKIAFIIPHTALKRALDDFMKSGKLNLSWIGISVGSVFNAEVSAALGLVNTSGCVIKEVESNSPAAIAGICVNDILLSVNRESVSNGSNVEYMLSSLPIGETIPVRVRRVGKDIEFKIKVASKNDDTLSHNKTEEVKKKIEISEEKVEGIGVGVADLTEERRQYYDIPYDINGVLVVSVANAQSEMSAGNVVMMVNQTVISSVADLRNAMKRLVNSKAKSFALYVYDTYRQEKKFYVAFKLCYHSSAKDDAAFRQKTRRL
jgi:serine protease Do